MNNNLLRTNLCFVGAASLRDLGHTNPAVHLCSVARKRPSGDSSLMPVTDLSIGCGSRSRQSEAEREREAKTEKRKARTDDAARVRSKLRVPSRPRRTEHLDKYHPYRTLQQRATTTRYIPDGEEGAGSLAPTF